MTHHIHGDHTAAYLRKAIQHVVGRPQSIIEFNDDFALQKGYGPTIKLVDALRSVRVPITHMMTRQEKLAQIRRVLAEARIMAQSDFDQALAGLPRWMIQRVESFMPVRGG